MCWEYKGNILSVTVTSTCTCLQYKSMRNVMLIANELPDFLTAESSLCIVSSSIAVTSVLSWSKPSITVLNSKISEGSVPGWRGSVMQGEVYSFCSVFTEMKSFLWALCWRRMWSMQLERMCRVYSGYASFQNMLREQDKDKPNTHDGLIHKD